MVYSGSRHKMQLKHARPKKREKCRNAQRYLNSHKEMVIFDTVRRADYPRAGNAPGLYCGSSKDHATGKERGRLQPV
jgi:hypothetical protein